MKVSFCITCRERLDDLQRTLPANLARLGDSEEIVVLDYNSPDGLREWVLATFASELAAARLRIYSERAAARFFMAHAKNVAHLLGRGEVLVNLDADNFLTPDYLATLRSTDFNQVSMLYPKAGSGGFKGRTAVAAKSFRAAGGYDEAMCHGYGYEEIDLFKRLRWLGYLIQNVRIDPETACIPTTDARKATGQPVGVTVEQSQKYHRKISDTSLRLRRFVANRDRSWGVAELMDHEDRRSVGGWSS